MSRSLRGDFIGLRTLLIGQTKVIKDDDKIFHKFQSGNVTQAFRSLHLLCNLVIVKTTEIIYNENETVKGKKISALHGVWPSDGTGVACHPEML